MRQAEKKKGKDKISAALMLCFCLIALVSVFTVKASIDKISESVPDVPAATKAPADTGKESAAEAGKAEDKGDTAGDAAEEASGQIPTVDSRNSGTSGSSKPEKKAFISPMDQTAAQIAKKYSMDMVIYNLTLDQYMTHPGIDFEAPRGTAVKAAAKGTVTDIYEDDAYGITIEITHSGGYITRYCNLATDKLCEKGDTVKQGQVISNVGSSALYESRDKAHLHFEVLKNGKHCDPSSVAALP